MLIESIIDKFESYSDREQQKNQYALLSCRILMHKE